MKTLLFVCTGNTCRSCMAEGIFNDAASKKENDIRHFKAYSAGLSAFEGDSANIKAIKVLTDCFGIDISSHRARRIQKSNIEDALIILTMTSEHRDQMARLYPQAQNKMHTLKEFVADIGAEKTSKDYRFQMDIPDPYGMSEEVYMKCAIEIKDAVDRLIMKLKEY